MKKTVFIIPGFRHGPRTKAYRQIAGVLRKEGYFPVFSRISWKQRTVSENAVFFLKEFHRLKRKKKYILGFSFGAMVALLASTRVRSSGLILCSLSPFFREDIAKVKINLMSELMAERYKDFAQLQSAVLAKKIKTKQVHMLYGAREAKSLKRRVHRTFDQIVSSRKKLTLIQKTEHEIGSIRYLQTIQEVARVLR